MTNATNQSAPEPIVYVACLAAYNAGRHHGVTIRPAEQDADEMAAAIRDMLARSPAPGAEEVIVIDFEDLPHNDMAQVFDLAKLADDAVAYVELCEQHDRGAVDAYADCHHGDMDGFEDAFNGVYESTRGFVDELLDDAYGDVLANIPDWIRRCIDSDDVWNQLSYDDFWCADVPGGVAIFWGA